VQRDARAWLGPVEHDNDALGNRDGYASEDFSEIQNDDETPGGRFAMDNGIQIAIVRPRNFRDAATVGEYYRQGIPVIINLEDVSNYSKPGLRNVACPRCGTGWGTAARRSPVPAGGMPGAG
jgi:hypothetical protein